MIEPIIIGTEADGAGMGRFAVELANALDSAGHPVTMVARPQPYGLRVTRQVVIAPPTVPTGWRKTLGLARQSLAIAAVIWRQAGRGRPVLLVHIAATVPVSLAPILAARLKRAPVALSLHDFYPHSPRYPRALRPLERWFYRPAYRRCDLILTNNSAQSQRLIDESGVAPQRVRRLFHGPFVVEGLMRSDGRDELRLLIFGTLRPNKRVLESIRAVRLLRGQGMAVTLRIAGAPWRGDAGYWARCLAEIQGQAEISGGAEIPAAGGGFDIQARFIADDGLAGVLSGVDAVLCPYAGFDSQSGVAVMAVSNGLPVIATAAARVAHVDLGAAPWGLVSDTADAVAIAQGVRAFAAVAPALRLGFADELQCGFLAAGGWETLAAKYAQAMRERAFWR